MPAQGRATRRARLAKSLARPAVDLRHLLPTTLPSQGPRPLCLPFAVGANHEAVLSNAGKPIAALAPESLWWRCTQLGQTSAAGVLFGSVASALTDAGQPDLSVWPYDESLGAGTEDPPTGAGLPPWRTAQVESIPIAHDGLEDEIESHLASATPVVLVLEVTMEFEMPAADGHVAVPNLRAPPGDFHAVLLVGAATHNPHGRCLLVRNSWGLGWGAGGYGWVPIPYLEAFAVEAGIVTLP